MAAKSARAVPRGTVFFMNNGRLYMTSRAMFDRAGNYMAGGALRSLRDHLPEGCLRAARSGPGRYLGSHSTAMTCAQMAIMLTKSPATSGRRPLPWQSGAS
jgi:hypothetical protein